MKRWICFLLVLLTIGTTLTVAGAAVQDDWTAVGEPDMPADEEPVIPRITGIVPANGGVTISFSAYEGAAKYRVFFKRADGAGWKGIGDTKALSLTYTGLTPNKPEIFTVRAIGADGKYCSGYDAQGYAYTYLLPPVLKSAESLTEGVKVTWNPVQSACGYRVYVKAANGWRLLTETTDTAYLDTNVVSGSRYTYTVKAYDIEHQIAQSFHDRTGITVKYIATPVVTACTPVQEGLKVTWNAVDGATRYRLFYKNGSGWKTIGNTSSTSYIHTNLVKGQGYIYTVRVIDANGKYISGYDRQGYSALCLATPVLQKAESVNGGVRVSWNAVDGARSYRLYVKTGSSWKRIVDTDATSFLDENVVSGSRYTYTVRAIQPVTGAMLSYFDRSGVTATYVATPMITGFEPADGGTKVTWNAVDGAVKYRLFYKTETSWKTIANTTGTSCIHTAPEAGREYVYTVRATDANGKYISGYHAGGWTYRYIAPPAVAEVVPADEGVNVFWDAVDDAAGYQLYRKSFGGSWKSVGKTADAAYHDADAPAEGIYTYTLRTLDANGAHSSYYIKDTPYYYHGALADGNIPWNGGTIRFKEGYVRQGYVTVDGKTYYYSSSGTLMKNGIVGSDSEGYRYADKDGVIDMTARLAVSSGGYDWNVIDGKAKKVSTAKDRTMHRALKLVSKLTKTTDTMAQKLRKCFDYLQTETYEYNPRVPHYRGMDWPIIYADDIFTTGGGNCLSYAAAFAFMAKAIGYDDVYACHSGGHGWTEIGGLIYDSEWQRSNHKYSYYGLSYYSSTDVNYLGVQVNFASNAWMHIEI